MRGVIVGLFLPLVLLTGVRAQASAPPTAPPQAATPPAAPQADPAPQPGTPFATDQTYRTKDGTLYQPPAERPASPAADTSQYGRT